MIQAKELRLGNLVLKQGFEYYDGKKVPDNGIKEVDYRLFEDVIDDPGHFDGISLTPEWLEGLDFKKYTGTTGKEIYKFPVGRLAIYKTGDDYTVGVFDFDGGYLHLVSLQYVHQLQNLYFALTGEELSIKQTA
jgi:hypothetical protein